MKKISILIPCYNEEASLPFLFVEINKLMDNITEYDWEVLLINDGSNDLTLHEMRKQNKKDKRICYLDLSRNYGKEVAMLAGFDYVTGDCTIIMDADLQHPPHIIPEMIKKWEEGFEDVYAERITRGNESWLRKKLSLLFYHILQKTTQINILQNVGDFRLLDKRCIDALKNMREHKRYTKGMFCWIGFQKTSIPYETNDRIAGKSSMNYLKLFKLAIDGLVSFTTAPLRLASIFGFITSFFTFVYMFYVIIKTIFVGESVAGYPTLIIVMLFLGSSILLCLGIIGEYISRIFVETKNRPTYIAREYNQKLI